VTIALYNQHAELYDRVYSAKGYAAEARRLVRRAQKLLGRRPRTLLDVACGTGRHLESFRRWVPEVEGVDLSPAMLRLARRRLGPGVRLTRADMRRFRLPRTFDLVVCLFSAFGYLVGPEARAEALRSFHQHLVPGGVVMVEGWVLPSHWRDGHVALQTYKGLDAAIARLSTARRRGRLTTLRMDYLVHARGRGVERFREQHRMEMVPTREVLAAMRRAGFRAQALAADSSHSRALYVGVRIEPRSTGAGPRPTPRSGA
jgi:SAM-dependent methyltransferase